ncbi:uncharacterized protein N0V89_009782 [Didymosphaeria variabile]|uniref:Nucleoporin Nup159/Nup146 N-terminal domain-containing protein n=1 Tax=Didymosphaeria variabile TaxID=1932322 RepID=A0A9W8XE01_9PLEO|nr:uncharacterized protein N0V89_009782 [Didymosphaeria variabile]KAJ4348408.1 hypothetical protein N0V89_009782 [Didymosphaeria variabile]
MSSSQVHSGAELEEISPEIIGFSPFSAGLEGPKTLKLLPSPWPTTNLPPASASLLSVGSRRGLLAAASPDKLVIASTQKIRKAFQEKSAEKDVVTSFIPDATLPVPQLRQVAFSADEDFLVTSAENRGGLSVYSLDDLLKGNTQPGVQIPTENSPVRALLPNPAAEQAHYMAVILDSGRLDITDITTGNARTVHSVGVTCASWSLKGKAFVAGFEDGTASIHLVSSLDQVKGRVPRPPEVGENYEVSAVNWLKNEELFLIYSPPANSGDDTLYYFVTTNKTYSSFTFRRTPFELIFASMDGPARKPPPRFSMQRLRKWEPDLDDMIIVTAANSADVGVVLRSPKPLDPAVTTVNEFQMTNLADHRKPTVPRNHEKTADSALIGEALDLSAKEKAPQPSRRLEEISESPTPLPAYFLLTHEGLLAGWWVVWDKALEARTAYQGMVINETAPAAPTSQSPQPSLSMFGQATLAQSSSFENPQATPAFGKPSFGAPAFGSPSAPAGSVGFGKPSFPSTTPSAAPAFGTPGLGGQKSLFGTPSQISSKPNPFGSGGSASQPSKIANPFAAGGSASQNDKPNPFAAAAAKFGGGSPGGASPFSSFSSNKDGQSGFGGLGQKPASGFGGLEQKPLSSFGSTVTVDSKATGTGSTLPSLGNTPAQQNSSLFGSDAASSFPSFTSTQSGSTDVGNRGRDEATPTPQPQPHLKEIAGVFGGKFELKSSFKGDGSAKDDLPKPDASSESPLFGNGFGSALTSANSKPPETPAKDANKAPLFASTTPATAPRPSNGLFGMRADSATPKAAPPQEAIPEEAPLPPAWPITNPSKTDDEIPPLAGSPPVKIEAPSSSGDMDEIPSSPLEDDEDEDLSNPDDEEEEEELSEEEEQTGDEDSETAVPSHVGQTPQQPKSSLFGANAAPIVFPAAPTPPPQKIERHPPKQNLSSSSMFSGTRRDPLTSSARPPSKPPTPQPIFSDLVDDEDERIRHELEAEIEPTRTLAPFIARQEYTEAALNKTGHAAQIEIVYRDINSMVDTLGLNSRSLQAFIDFHEQPQRDSQLDRSALEEVLDEGQDGPWFEKWSLCEIEDLIDLEGQIAHELSTGGIGKVVDKLSKSVRLIQENAKLQSKVNDERRRIINSKDPEKLEALRKAALPKELADQQKQLRKDYAQLLTQLGKAEDALILLRSKLASHNAKNGHMGAVPSVEAVKKTINKLIDITKEKNHDITLLESQLRKASLTETSRPVSASSRTAATPLRKSRAVRNETVFATPPTSKSMSLRQLNQVAMTPEQSDTPSKGYGLFYTPEGSPSGCRNLASLADMVDDDLERLRETAKRRRDIAASLATALKDRGVKKTVVA